MNFFTKFSSIWVCNVVSFFWF